MRTSIKRDTHVPMLLAALVGVATLADRACADTVMLMADAPQTRAGQRYEFRFDTLPPSSGSGWIAIQARGDYTWAEERIHWNIDDIACGVAGPSWGGTVLKRFGRNDVLWEQQIPFDAERMSRITDDGEATVWLDLSRKVNVFCNPSWVKVTLTYETDPIVADQDEAPVPEPAALGLLALGTGALAIRRRKNMRGPTLRRRNGR